MKNNGQEQASDAPPEDVAAALQAPETPEDEAIYYDISIFCHPRNVNNLVQALELQIKQAEGELPLSVIWSGFTSLLHQGMILLQSKGKPPAAFLRDLSIDYEIFDFAVADWVKGEEAQESANVKEEQEVQSQGSEEAARGGTVVQCSYQIGT